LKTFSDVWEISNLSGVLFDTSAYINALRSGDLSIFAARRLSAKGENQSQPLWLSSVVLEELYVGATNKKLIKLLEKFERDFEKVNRLIVPNLNDWTTCGRVLSLIGRKYGFEEVKKARMTNDCLIAMSIARNGLTVLTHNAEDFRMIAEFRPFKWQEI
jgi:predicted nucleic acid-binding protein